VTVAGDARTRGGWRAVPPGTGEGQSAIFTPRTGGGNPQSEVNPQSAIFTPRTGGKNPQSEQSAIGGQSAIRNPQSAIGAVRNPQSAIDEVCPERAAALTLDLVSIPSPTGDTAAVSGRFAEELRSLGMEVELFREFPATPVVIGRLPGSGPGRTLILNGHLDTVPIPHAPPERRNGRVYGRGTADMKGPLAAAVEALRAARAAGLRFAGEVVLCAHGLHEAPDGHAEDLEAALRRGAVRGDAAIVLEAAHDTLPVTGLGSGIYRAAFRRPVRGASRAAPVTHELMTPPGTPHPAPAAAEAVLALRGLSEALQKTHVERIGPESVFIGQVHCGDSFNRFPNEAWIEGVRRYGPDRTAAEVGAELRALLEPVAARHGLELAFTFTRVRDGFRVSPDHPLVAALQAAVTAESGAPLPLTGIKIVADAPVFQKTAGIPCLYHGPAGEGAHGDVESIAESELGRAARVYLRTLAAYLGET
jgi:acetylornithine deacetylase/succinyl-diaminopimelate desuccinylase-like protein